MEVEGVTNEDEDEDEDEDNEDEDEDNEKDDQGQDQAQDQGQEGIPRERPSVVLHRERAAKSHAPRQYRTSRSALLAHTRSHASRRRAALPATGSSTRGQHRTGKEAKRKLKEGGG
eukprot:3517354-Rhodomonas_salina.1